MRMREHADMEIARNGVMALPVLVGIGILSWSAEAGIAGCPGCGIKLDGTELDFVFGLGVEGKISETMFARLDFLTGGDLAPMVFGQA